MRTKTGPRSGRGGKSVPRQNSLKGSSQVAASELETDFHNDVSQQQVPIPTSVRSMRDLCRLMETATEEVREYLTEEFSIMYECKTCYSIFRSLANLISHKRFYCTTRFINRPRPADRDYVLEQLTQLVIPTEPDASTEERWHLADDGQGGVANGQSWATSIRTSIPPIGQGGSGSKTRDSADGGTVPAPPDKKPSAEFSVHLERLTKNAVYQTVSYEGTIGDLMSDQVAEVQSLSIDSQVTLGPDGKILSEQPHCSAESVQEEDQPSAKENVAKTALKKIAKNELQTTGSQYYVCGICSSTCSTRKTLAYHMQYMHSKYRMCYPCICCKSTFSKIWNVTRHLCKVHHKSTHQVNKLREIIQKKAFRKPLKDCKKPKEVKVKSEAAARSEPNSKLSKQQQLIQENQIFMENVDGISKTQVCVACGTKFERQAALYSHLQRCPKQLRKLKLQNAAAGDADVNARPAAEAETAKNPARLCSVSGAVETDDDYDEDDQRVSLMLTDIPPIASHISFAAKGVDAAAVDPEEVSQQIMTDRGRSEKMQIMNPYRCGSERDSSTEKKIKIEVRKDYVKSVGSSTKNTLCSALADDFSEVASPMSAMCYRGENSDSDDGGKGSVGGSEGQGNQLDVLELGVGFGDKERTLLCSQAEGQEPEGAHKRFLFSREMIVSSPKMLSVLKKSPELNSGICIGISNKSALTPENAPDVKPEVNLSATFPRKKSAFSPHMQKKMEALINANKLQCLTCRKKFKKMTNLRRHVALHIDWYRYRCTMCSFRCFAKYDCVAHVIKAHLKGADRVQASGFVELLQSQEPDCQVADDGDRPVDIRKSDVTVNTVKDRLEVQVFTAGAEVMDVDSDHQEKHFLEHGNYENVPKEPGLETLGTSCPGTLSEETSPHVVDSPNFNMRGKLENANILQELNVKCNEKSQMCSVGTNNGGNQSRLATKDILLESELDIVFDRYLSEQDGFSNTEELCSRSVDDKLCISTSCYEVHNFQADEGMSLDKDTDISSTEGAAERDERDPGSVDDNIVTHVDSCVETAATPESMEQATVPAVDGSVERTTLPAQNPPEEISVIVKSSPEKVVSPMKHVVIGIGSPEQNLEDEITKVYKINSSLRCSVDKEAALRKVIDKIVLHGRDVNLRNVGSNSHRHESRDISESVLFDSGKFSVSSDISQRDFNLPVMNCDENSHVPDVCVKTEVDSDITIEYEGKRLTARNPDGGFIPRRRRERIGSDSNMMYEADELGVHVQGSLLDGHYPPKKRKRSHSESRGWARRSGRSCFSCDHNVDAGTPSENDMAKSSTCSVEESPIKDMAVQQMVMQVIFGSENGQESREDFTLNGDVFVPKGGDYCPSAAESASTASSSPNWVLEEPLSNYDSVASPDSDAAFCTATSQQKKSCGSGSARKRLRPIRNRVKVEREDFIYDYGLSDICILQKEKVSEDAKKSAKRKEQVERCGKESPGKVNVRHSVYPNLLGQDVKLVLPKLTLVRTDDPSVRNEYCVKLGEDPKTSNTSGPNPGKSGLTSRKKTSATS